MARRRIENHRGGDLLLASVPVGKVEKNDGSTTEVARRRAEDRGDIEDSGGGFLNREYVPIGNKKNNKARGNIFNLNRGVVSILCIAVVGAVFAEHSRRSSSACSRQAQANDEQPEREREEARIADGLGIKTDESGSIGAMDEVRQSRPDNWQKYGWSNMKTHFDCRRRAKDKTKAMHTEEDWKVFIETYERTNRNYSFDDPVKPTEGYSIDDEHNIQPWRPGYSDHGGRGLFASRDLKKGELVHVGANSDVIVPDADTFREYIFFLGAISVEKACDMLSWCWTQEDKDEVLRIRCSMNIAILMNTGSGSQANVGPKWDDDPDARFYAKRDIKKDEEILMDYSIYDTNYAKVGLKEIEIE